METANDYTKRNFVFRLHAPDGSEFLFGADSEEQQEEWVRQCLQSSSSILIFWSTSISFWYIVNCENLMDLTKLVSGEEDQVPRGVATKPTAHQLQGFRWGLRAKRGETLFIFGIITPTYLYDYLSPCVNFSIFRKPTQSHCMQISQHRDQTTYQSHR